MEIEGNVEGGVIKDADQMFVEIVEKDVFEVAGDVLVVAVGNGSHIEVAFDELISRPGLGENLVILDR